jgi:glycosyltransferase involved in cell wall biosynthesis
VASRAGSGPPKVAFVYPNPRAELAARVARGEAPDSTLLGQNHLLAFGLDAWVHDPALTRRRGGRLRWNLREVPLPWELGDAEVAFTPLAGLFPLAARVRRRPRVVVVNFGLCTTWARSSHARRALLSASLRSAAAVVCLGEWQRDRLEEQTGAHATTALLGIDERYFSPRPAPGGGDPYVLAVGKDLARDYATFAEAVRRLGVRAEIAAYPRNLEGVRLAPRTRARAVSAAQLRDLYAEAACVVVPQRRQEYPYGSEGGGLTTLLETLAMARPLVATDRPILHDYVADGETALLVPPEEPEALAEAIGRVLGDDELARRLGEAGRARVEEELTTRRFARRIAPLLHAAADRRRFTRRLHGHA